MVKRRSGMDNLANYCFHLYRSLRMSDLKAKECNYDTILNDMSFTGELECCSNLKSNLDDHGWCYFI